MLFPFTLALFPFPFPFPSWAVWLFPFPWDSHGNGIPMGFPTPMHTSTIDFYGHTRRSWRTVAHFSVIVFRCLSQPWENILRFCLLSSFCLWFFFNSIFSSIVMPDRSESKRASYKALDVGHCIDLCACTVLQLHCKWCERTKSIKKNFQVVGVSEMEAKFVKII